jgi:cytochrome c-type biogenesis protein CcsB
MNRAMYRFLLLLSGLAAAVSAEEAFDWRVWRELPVRNGGRPKPLDSLGWETVRGLANQNKLVDPASGLRLEPVAAYMAMLLDWQGWDHPARDEMLRTRDWRPLYFFCHSPDKWDRAPLLRVDSPALRSALGLAAEQRRVSPEHLDQARVADPRSERRRPFSGWAEELRRRSEDGEALTELEEQALQLANQFWSYQNHRMGRTMEVLPVNGSEEGTWLSLAHLTLAREGESAGMTEELPRLRELFARVRNAFRVHDARAFNESSREFVTALRGFGERSDNAYPSAALVRLEVAYHHWVPVRVGWVLMLSAALLMLAHRVAGWAPLRSASFPAYGLGLLAVSAGIAVRVIIAGRPPVTNMYESVVYVGAGAAWLGLLFELIEPRRYTLAAAAAVSAGALALSDQCSLVLDPSVRPLEPVLRSNFWLVAHVMTITLSYAALALAAGIANITLGYCLIRSENQAAIRALSRLIYRCVQAGVLLLAAGVILGGIWADYAWGRFWGWDPKEVWALVALLGYLAVLHARFAGWVDEGAFAALTAACFSLVVMAWYGVNFVLGAGLHSYGFGGGGQGYVLAAVVVQLLYAGISCRGVGV